MLQFFISCSCMWCLLCLTYPSHTSTSQKFKVHLKLYFLYVAYSLTTIIYYLCYSPQHPPTCIILHCIHVFLLLLDCKLPKGENHASYHFAHLHVVWRSVSAPSREKLCVNCTVPLLSSSLFSSTMSSTLQFSNKYLVDLLEYLIVIRRDFQQSRDSHSDSF